MENNRQIYENNYIKFSYVEKIIEDIDETEFVEVYSDIIILEIFLEDYKQKFKVGDAIEQISISIRTFFEYNDGTPY
jgi:hypothetical protein